MKQDTTEKPERQMAVQRGQGHHPDYIRTMLDARHATENDNDNQPPPKRAA